MTCHRRLGGQWGKSSWEVDWDPSGVGNKPRAHHCILTMLGGTFKLQPPISHRIGGCLLLLIIMMCCCCCLLLLLSLLWTVSTCPATTFKNHADETLRSVSCAGRFLGIIYGSNSECFQVQHVVIFWFFFFLLLECIPYIDSSQLSVSWSQDVTWSPWYNLRVTRTNKRRTLSPHEAEIDMVDSWLFTLYRKHVPYNSCTSWIWVLYCISIFLDWRLGFEPTLQLKGLKFESPSKWNSYEGFNLEH